VQKHKEPFTFILIKPFHGKSAYFLPPAFIDTRSAQDIFKSVIVVIEVLVHTKSRIQYKSTYDSCSGKVILLQYFSKG